MKISRRQLLFLGGVVGGGIITGAAQRVLSSSSNVSSISNVPQVKSESIPSSNAIAKVPIAPKGLFAPVRGDVRILVISDLNSAYGSTDYEPQVTQSIQMIPDWQPDLILCGGDMVAGQYPSLTKAEIEAMWAGFDRYIAKPIRQTKIPYGFTIGNHDASGALSVTGKFLFGNERDLASAYWNNPQNDPGLKFVDRAGFPFYYTFEQNNIFYLVWDASTGQIPKTQLVWVEKALASTAAQTAKMRIAIGHLPLYAVAVGRNEAGEILADNEKLRSLLEKYKVHTYISGHDHAYYPARKGKLELLHAGALGSGPRPWLNSKLRPINPLTIIDINLNSQTTDYTTYNMQTLEVVDHQTLPRMITSVAGTVLRRDLKAEDLTSEERSLLNL
ncbi:putative phosphohydrolase [Synechococcus sp. PCC 7502]|uniref:metallophosphoesterase family protein n=1 Tax=Synechococcus sp. PCC 7502 TaxID=1173263 RepID=UPI00029FA827|nr:metallophosphoesterase [Synechococcus sp. PCC 7502]AFY74718.1 putative phosphohydrolase [Synechococcus sp. PCC 7502]